MQKAWPLKFDHETPLGFRILIVSMKSLGLLKDYAGCLPLPLSLLGPLELRWRAKLVSPYGGEYGKDNPDCMYIQVKKEEAAKAAAAKKARKVYDLPGQTRETPSEVLFFLY